MTVSSGPIPEFETEPSVAAPQIRRRLDRKFLERSTRLGAVQVAMVTGTFLVLILLASIAGMWWEALPLIVAIGFAQHRIFFPIHDCIHYTLFPNKRQNAVAGSLLSPLIGTSFAAIRDQHLEHHRDFGKPEDPGAPDYFVRFDSKLELLQFLLGPLVGTVFVSGIGRYFRRPAISASAKHHLMEEEWIFTSSLKSYGLILLAQAIIAAVLTRGFQPGELWRYPVFYILPLITVFLFCNRLRMFAEHGALDYEVCDYFEGKRPTARTIYASWWERLFLCGNSFNFHHEHHRYPMVPGWQLPRLHRELEAELEPEDVRPTYLRALAEIWSNLPLRSQT